MSNSPEEPVTHTQRIYEGKIINLRVDQVQLPSGNGAKREIVEHRGAVAMVPLTAAGEVILVRQYRSAAGKKLLEIPAGTRDAGEDVAECAQRELGEEINFRAGRMTPLFQAYMAPGYSTELIYFFLAEDLTPFEGQPDDDEDLELVTEPLASALARIDSGEIQDAKSISALLYVDKRIREGSAG